MIVLVQANVLTVGLNGRDEILKELPIRLISVAQAQQAVRMLREDNINSVVGAWDENEDNQKFLTKLRKAKPEIPTIVFVPADDPEQEIIARSLGFSAVLTEDSSDELFKLTIANVLGLKANVSIREIITNKQTARDVEAIK